MAIDKKNMQKPKHKHKTTGHSSHARTVAHIRLCTTAVDSMTQKFDNLVS